MSFNKLRNTDLPGAGAGLAPDVPELQIWKWKCSVAVWLLGDSLSNFHAFVSCFSGLSKSPHNKFFGQSASPDLWDLSPLWGSPICSAKSFVTCNGWSFPRFQTCTLQQRHL